MKLNLKQDRISKYVQYDMIQTNTELPPLPGARLSLLQAFLNRQQLETKVTELFSLAISLIQLGLDTHEQIDTAEELQSERQMRSRQLKVLAGDYFSANFYHLLAKSGQVDMILRISEAVCEFNRLKVNLYVQMRQMKVTAEQYLNQVVELRSTLFLLFESMLKDNLAKVWPELLGRISRCEALLEELDRIMIPNGFHNSWAYWQVLQTGTEEEREKLTAHSYERGFVTGLIEKYKLKDQLSELLQQSLEEARTIIDMLEPISMSGELTRILDELFERHTNAILPFQPAR